MNNSQNNEKGSSSDNDLTEIKQIDSSKISIVKDFIMEQHEKLDRKEFFIVDDIETELPIIFQTGVVLAIIKENKILGLQAIDFSNQNSSNLKSILENVYQTDYSLYELGWTMIHSEHRNNQFGTLLLNRILGYLNKTHNCVLIATVHPDNVAALKLYTNNGFVPILTTKYFGVDRVFLIKEHYTDA